MKVSGPGRCDTRETAHFLSFCEAVVRPTKIYATGETRPVPFIGGVTQRLAIYFLLQQRGKNNSKKCHFQYTEQCIAMIRFGRSSVDLVQHNS